MSPSGQRSQNLTTQSRTICPVTPPIWAASVRLPGLVDRSQSQQPPRLARGLAQPGRTLQPIGVKISPGRKRLGKPPWFATLRQTSTASRKP